VHCAASELVWHSSRRADWRSPAEQGADNGDAGDCVHAREVGHHYSQGRRTDLHATCATHDLCEFLYVHLRHSRINPLERKGNYSATF